MKSSMTDLVAGGGASVPGEIGRSEGVEPAYTTAEKLEFEVSDTCSVQAVIGGFSTPEINARLHVQVFAGGRGPGANPGPVMNVMLSPGDNFSCRIQKADSVRIMKIGAPANASYWGSVTFTAAETRSAHERRFKVSQPLSARVTITNNYAGSRNVVFQLWKQGEPFGPQYTVQAGLKAEINQVVDELRVVRPDESSALFSSEIQFGF